MTDSDTTDTTDSTDSSEPGTQLDEESQQERGEMGSRDTGDPEPAGGPTSRPSGESDADDHTSINPQDADEGDSPNLSAGGG